MQTLHLPHYITTCQTSVTYAGPTFRQVSFISKAPYSCAAAFARIFLVCARVGAKLQHNGRQHSGGCASGTRERRREGPGGVVCVCVCASGAPTDPSQGPTNTYYKTRTTAAGLTAHNFLLGRFFCFLSRIHCTGCTVLLYRLGSILVLFFFFFFLFFVFCFFFCSSASTPRPSLTN